MKKNNKKIKEKTFEKSIEDIWTASNNDPYGSYLGTSIDEKRPVQDADDL